MLAATGAGRRFARPERAGAAACPWTTHEHSARKEPGKRRMNLPSFFAVGFGAFAGAVLRWFLGMALNPLLPTLPLGTLAANLCGGLIMGFAMGSLEHYQAVPMVWRLALTTGFLGGLTTFSTFSAETVLTLQRQQYFWTATIVGAHVLGSLLATIAGIGLVRLFLRA